MVTDAECGEIVCSNCGLVSQENMTNSRAEWRVFGSENNNDNNSCQMVGSPNSLAFHDMGLSTIIGEDTKDSRGHKLDASMSSTMQRLRTWNFRSQAHSSAQRNRIAAFSELGRLKDKLALSDAIVEKTAYIYRKAQEKGLVKGRAISPLLAVAIYMACREMGTPRSLHEMAAITNIRSRVLSHYYRMLVHELGISVPLIHPARYIAKIATKTKISERTQRTAIDTMKKVIEREISAGKNPIALAATVLYVSCRNNDEKVTQNEIAVAAGITEATIRNRFKDLKVTLSCLT